MRQINRVAVLGSGVMGATIAAHMTNAGLDVLMLDMVPTNLTEAEKKQDLSLADPQVRNRLATIARDNLRNIKPAPLFLPEEATRIRVGNLDDDLQQLTDCDWVIEVIVEDLAIKQQLLERIANHLGEQTLLSSNTSGLSINTMAELLPAEQRSRFLVTHFFNPPRYMRLVELVPSRYTDPAVTAALSTFISKRLGKGVVYAKDTPNFIANRIGVFSIFNAIKHMLDLELTVEEVDSIAGPATARPKSAAFRTADLVGIDTLAQICHNTWELLPEDEQRDTFRVPEFMETMIKAGQLGNKSKQGFYRKEEVDGQKTIFFYDYRRHEYLPLQKSKFPSVTAVKMIDDPATRLSTLLGGHDKGAEFAWRTLRDTLLYTFNRIGEIADDIVNIDNAMKWGFNWEIGPFEMFDAIGVDTFIKRAEQDGVTVPEHLRNVSSFYRSVTHGDSEYVDPLQQTWQPIQRDPEQIILHIIKKSGGVVEKNAGASVIDVGDGVFVFEFHSKMNTISNDILAMTHKAIKRAETEGVGLVIGNQGTNFSVGANLMLLAVAMAEGAYEDIDMMVRAFQKATMAIKYAKVPVVAAPFGMSLGGGCEFSMHAAAINAHAETYMGLVEIGVGLLPAGGGTKEMCLRAVNLAQQYEVDVSPFIFNHFKTIAMAKVSMGAAELDRMALSGTRVGITMNIDQLLAAAKKQVLALAANYRPGRPLTQLPAPGRSIAASIKSHLWNMREGNFISPYDAEIGGLIADVICGGDVLPGTLINEQDLLDLERQAFLTLCGNKKTAERIQHMLKKGKPLRN